MTAGLRRPWRLAAAVAVALGAMGGLATPASAHATLESTDPPSGAVLARSPGKVVLHFDQQVEVAFGSIRVYDSHAHRVDSGNATHPGGDSHSVEVALPSRLATGGYVVTWRVISADSHPVHGAFTFSIGSSGAVGIRGEAAQLVAQSSGSKPVGIVFGVARFLAFAAVALALGGGLFLAIIWPEGRADRRARRLVWSGFALLVVSTAASFALQGPYGGALPLADAVKPSVLTAVSHTRFGHVYAARLVLLVGFGAVLARLLARTAPPGRPSTALLASGGFLGVGVLATWGPAAHAGTGTIVPVALPFDLIHVGAAAIWVGGLALTVGAVLPARAGGGAGGTTPLRGVMPRFSQWALGAAVAVAVSGAFAAWHEVGLSWGALTTTPYGRLLIYKTAGFASLVGLAVFSRTAVHGNLAVPFRSTAPRRPVPAVSAGPGAMAADPDGRIVHRLRSAVTAEVVVALAVLAFTAVLVEVQPASEAYAAPYSAEVKAGPTLVNAVVDPAKAGPVAIHLYILTPDGAQDAVPEVDATLSNQPAGITDLTVPLTLAGPGHFVAYGFQVPIRGTWVLQVQVRTDTIDQYYADPITVHFR